MAEVVALKPLFERLPAQIKKFKEVVVMVHHYDGNRHSFKRHMEWLNEIGFDVVTFNLPFRNFSELRHGLPLSKDWSLGLRHVWGDKIEEVFGQIAENKFVFSFSLPAAAALRAIALRHAVDIKGWVTEGGPFSHVAEAGEGLFKHHIFKGRTGLLANSHLRKWIVRLSGVALGAQNIEADCRRFLMALPQSFSVLSLRGARDPMVAPHMIDEIFFHALKHIDLERVLFEKAEHLTALRDEPQNYKHVVENFLLHRATAVS